MLCGFFGAAFICLAVAAYKGFDRYRQMKRRATVSDPIRACVEENLDWVRHEIRLWSRQALWWYLLPLAVGELLLVFSVRWEVGGLGALLGASSLADQTIAAGAVLTTSIPAAGALTVYPLRPAISAAIANGNTLNLAVRSLKPGFIGSIERSADLSQADGWREVGASAGSDFLFNWSEPVGATPAFYRFRQL